MTAEELATQMIFAYAESSPETGDGFTPYASAFLAMREALEETPCLDARSMPWSCITDDDTGLWCARCKALAQADALLKGGERG